MIIFEKIRFKNFFSFGDRWTTIDLESSSRNLVMGTNGSGKSSALLDAITFALYGKPYRKTNKPLVVNSINQKNCVVEIKFRSGTNRYKVCRGLKPNSFEIYKNGKKIDQDSSTKDYQKYLEENVLKMNFDSFTQVVILGKATFTPFMQLSPMDRRKVIENILDMEIFSVMNVVLKKRMNILKDELKDIDYNVRLFQEKIEYQNKYIDNIKVNHDTNIENNRKSISECEEKIKEYEENIKKIDQGIEKFQNKTQNVDKAKDRYNQIRQDIQKRQNEIKRFKKEVNFFRDNEKCPTCMQDIDKNMAADIVEDRYEKVQELKDTLENLSDRSTKAEEYLQNMEEIISKITDLQAQKSKYQSEVSSTNRYIQKLNKEIQTWMNESSENIDEERTKLKEFETSVQKFQKNMEDKKSLMNDYKILSGLFKDSGLKSQIIKKYVPIINKVIRKYIQKFDFNISFAIDENFNEVIKNRYCEDYKYDNFSEGEKMRIDLALIFVWREISKMRNSVYTNILILDEILDSSLDQKGVEGFMNVLTSLEKDTNVFVITHVGDRYYDSFDRVIEFQKTGNYSRKKFDSNEKEK